MKILLDHNLPKQLASHLPGHLVLTVRQRRWDQLSNGILLAAAENEEFHLLLTADKGIYSQQNHRNRTISLIILGSNKFSYIEPRLNDLLAAINRASPGSYEFLPIPLPPKTRSHAPTV